MSDRTTDPSERTTVIPGAPGTASVSDEALKKAGVPLFGYGKFVTAFINFVIIAFVIFLIVKAANKAMAKPAEAPAEPPGPTPSEALLAEIRDQLRKGRG